MNRAVAISICLSLLLFLLAVPVAANIRITLDKDLRKSVDVGAFGFDKGGIIRFKIRDLVVAGLPANKPIPPQMGFVVDTVETDQSARGEIKYNRATTDDACFVDNPDLNPTKLTGGGVRIVYFFNGTAPASFIKSDSPAAFSDTPDFQATIPRRGMYGIFFFNCILGEDGKRIKVAPATSMKVHIDAYNIDESTGTKSYLPLGQKSTGTTYLLFCLFYAVLLILWRRAMMTYPQHVKRVHNIVQFLFVVKAVALLCETFKYYHYAKTGEPSLWDFFYYVFLTLKGVTLFAVIVLLGSGWSSARAFLSDNDKKLLQFLLPAQVVLNVLIAILEEASEGYWWWSKLLDVFRLLDVGCLLAVLLPLVWSMKQLREAAEQEEKAQVNLARMRTFRTFYLVFVGYIYATRVVLTFVQAAVPFWTLWVVVFFRELCAALLYAYIYQAFSPGPQPNPYEQLDPEAAMAELAGEDTSDRAELRKRVEMEAPDEVVIERSSSPNARMNS